MLKITPPIEVNILSRWRCRLMQFRTLAELLGFLLVLEAVFGIFEAHTGVHLKEVFEVVGHSPPWANPCSSGTPPPREDNNRIPELGDDYAEDCFVANCRWKASEILWLDGYVRLITGSRLSKSYHIQWVRDTTPPGSHIPILMNLPS